MIVCLVLSLEEVSQDDDILEKSAVLVLSNAVGGNHGKMNSFLGCGCVDECLQLVLQIVMVFTVNCEEFACELDFAEIDDVVLAVDDEVDLRTFWGVSFELPGIAIADDSRNAKSFTNLVKMLYAYPLECETSPGGMHGRVQ